MHFQLRKGSAYPTFNGKRLRFDPVPNPSLHPAFRVRRGTRTVCVDMKGYVGSRASGLPARPHAFSALRRSYAPTATALTHEQRIFARVAGVPDVSNSKDRG